MCMITYVNNMVVLYQVDIFDTVECLWVAKLKILQKSMVLAWTQLGQMDEINCKLVVTLDVELKL